MNHTDPFISAKEAADLLGIQVATLYAYVSRGLIRSEETDGSSRRRRYRREDVAALLQRKALRQDPTQVVESALHFGAPLLESAITLIQDGQLYYRGEAALGLARSRTLEEVAELVWEWPDSGTEAPLFPTDPPFVELPRSTTELPPIEAFQAILPLAAAADPTVYDHAPTAVARCGARMLAQLCLVASGSRPSTSVASALQQAWLPEQPESQRLLNAILILCADHELNVSAFTARCVASAGGTPYGAVQAGLAALQGNKHGGHTEQVSALFAEVGTPDRAAAVIRSRLRRGDRIPGFGHALYPQGDPRARYMLDRLRERYPDAPALALASAIEQAAGAALGKQPVLDFGLVTVARVLGLPADAPLILFALGRTVGWIGHIMEQYARDELIRPRARYTGPGVTA